MLQLYRTDSNNSDFLSLIPFLDRELRDNDGDEADYYANYNKPDGIPYVVVAYENNVPAGCGALKPYKGSIIEVKRMFVPQALRGKGISKMVLQELEKWARELGYTSLILETGKTQKAAIGLYLNSGFGIIPNYDQYVGVINSVCMHKEL